MPSRHPHTLMSSLLAWMVRLDTLLGMAIRGVDGNR